MIREVFFDVNETLTDFSGLRMASEELGISQHELRTWFSGLLRDGFALALNGQSANFRQIGEQLLISMTMQKGLSVDAEKVSNLLDAFANLPAHKDLSSTVLALAKSGYRINTLSNGSSELARNLMQNEGIDGLVSNFLSVSAGVWKPHPEAYRFGLAAVGEKPSACALVAVHPWDIHGAMQAGMRGVWINRENVPYPNYFNAPTAIVESLSELPEALSGIA